MPVCNLRVAASLRTVHLGAGANWQAAPMSEPPELADDAMLTDICPRCREQVHQRFYGPCDSCRDELRATVGLDAHEVETEAFEPKMNVTPNAVALKD